MAFETYWMQVFSPVSRKLKNGLHLIEAEPWRKGWWKVRSAGSARSTYISPAFGPLIPPCSTPASLLAKPCKSFTERIQKMDQSPPANPYRGLAGQYVSLAQQKLVKSKRS